MSNGDIVILRKGDGSYVCTMVTAPNSIYAGIEGRASYPLLALKRLNELCWQRQFEHECQVRTAAIKAAGGWWPWMVQRFRHAKPQS